MVRGVENATALSSRVRGGDKDCIKGNDSRRRDIDKNHRTSLSS